MGTPGPVSVVLLSDKSSGSSILQRALAEHAAVNLLRRTPHQENETLFWAKAAAARGLPQPHMIDSHAVPMSARTGQQALLALLRDNVEGKWIGPVDERLIFRSWVACVRSHGPIFFEKSPHHLHNRHALDLLVRCDFDTPDIDFRYIGLIRNPVDTMYSMWRRWRVEPEQRQHEWVRAYDNLSWFAERVGDRLLIVRYEDVVDRRQTLKDLARFIGLEPWPGLGAMVQEGRTAKWRSDATFGYQPCDHVLDVARRYGYRLHEVTNQRRPLWPLARRYHRLVKSGRRLARVATGRYDQR